MIRKEEMITLFDRAIEASQCRPLVRSHLDRAPFPATPLILSVGKSAATMGLGARDRYPDAPLHIFTSASYAGENLPAHAVVHPGEHPIPLKGSFTSGKVITDLVAGADRPILLLLSGGGSSLVEAPLTPWVDESLIRDLADLLLTSDFSIEEINCLRKHLSAIKGGRLAHLAAHPVTTLLFSDVPGGREDLIASGPTLPDPSSLNEARALLERLPSGSVVKRTARLFSRPDCPETPKEVPAGCSAHLLASNSTLLAFCGAEVEGMGFRPEILMDNGDAPVEEAIKRFSTAFSKSRPGEALLGGGEFTYALPPEAGRGGRALHFAALWSMTALERFPDSNWILLAAASDGHDGNGPSSGVIVTGEDISRHAQSLAEVVERADTFDFWEKHGTLLPQRSTGINLRDFFILLHL